MKKKIGSIFALVILQLICLTAIYGYQIEVKADFPDIVQQGDYVRYRMYTAAHSKSVDLWNSNKGPNGWMDSSRVSYTPSYENYVVKGIFFHSAPNCSYPTGGSTKYYYASYSSEYIGDDIRGMGSISNLDTPINNVVSSNYEEQVYRPMYNGLGGDYGEERMSVLNTAATSGNRNNIYVADDYLSVSYVNEILDTFNINSDGSVYFSYNTQTLLPGGNSMRTSRQFYNVTDGKWFSNVRGYMNYDINQPDGLLSAINYYDNIMRFPELTGGKGKKVYVRQINLEEADIERLSVSDLLKRLTGNTSAPVINSQGQKTGKVINATVEADYQEVYTLRGNEGIQLSNVNSGIEYLGYVKATSTRDRDGKIIPRLNVSGKSATVNILPNNKEEKIYVDFFYREISPNTKQYQLSGTLHFQSTLSDGNGGGAFEGNTEGTEDQDLTMDYIPPDELLRGGIRNAYPYILHAMDIKCYEIGAYGDDRLKGNEVVNVKWEIPYNYSFMYTESIDWSCGVHGYRETIYSGSVPGRCPKYEDEADRYDSCMEDYEDCMDSTTNPGVCGALAGKCSSLRPRSCNITKTHHYNTASESDVSRTNRNYLIPYKYQFYNITNFKLFRLYNAVLHDEDGQIGGVLFEKGDGSSLGPNEIYNQRFNKCYVKINPDHWVAPASHGHTEGDPTPGNNYSAAYKDNWYSSAKSTWKGIVNGTNVSWMDAKSDQQYALSFQSTLYVQNDEAKLETLSLLETDLKTTTVSLSSYGRTTAGKKIIEMYCKKPDFNVINGLKPNGPWPFGENTATQMKEFTNSNLIPLKKENGKRVLSSTLQYTLITDTKNNLNYGGQENQDDNTRFYPSYKTLTPKDPTWKYMKLHLVEGINNVEPVVVHAPIKAGGYLSDNNGVIDQTTEGEIPSDVIQKNTIFRIAPLCEGGGDCGDISEHPRYTTYSGPITFRKYIKGYLVTVNFDYQIPGRGETIYSSGTWTYFPANEQILLQANKRINEGMGNVVEQEHNTYQLRTVAINASDKLVERIRVSDLDMSYIGNAADNGNDEYNASYAGGICYANNKYVWAHGKSLLEEATYLAQSKEKQTTNLDRMYDFRVTDLLDVDWKNVFRKYDNTHTGNYYTAGRRGWNMYSGELNETGNITSSTPDGFRTDIGSNPYRTLPLGTYKHANSQYTSAPKMGYRFSFDLKTTGEIKDEKKQTKQIDIKAKFYYISKDGQTYYSNNEIDLYYQDTSGKYVKIQNGKNTGYTIKMRPSDGYRYIDTSFTANMLSTNLIEISNDLINIKLDSKSNMTKNEKNFTQLWYGEYKLPNSTIAVLNSNAGGNSDVNKPLRDGYIGVIFDITLTEKNNGVVVKKLSYNTNTSGNGANSSQWDYEGHFGIYDNQRSSRITTSAVSNSNTIFIPLEKGNDTVNGAKGLKIGSSISFNKYTSGGKYNKVTISGNEFYNQIKGTVIMYDTDARAAEDFDFSSST